VNKVEESKKLGRVQGQLPQTLAAVEPVRTIDIRPSLGSGNREEADNLLVDYFRLFSRRRWLIATFALAGASPL